MKLKMPLLICTLALSLPVISMSSLAENTALKPVKTSINQKEKINFNIASFEQLKIPRLIGEKRALAILAWREKNGNIASFDELLKAKDLNIGVKIISALQEKFILN